LITISRRIIRDIIIPIVERMMSRDIGDADIRDPDLEKYLEDELRAMYGVAGGNNCELLRTVLEDARRRDSARFNETIKKLVQNYVRLRRVVHPLKPKSQYGDKREEVREYVKKKKEREQAIV
jgi:hypothetical protein